MQHIRLNFINRSKDANDSQILLFQKNETPAGTDIISWRVIADCKPGKDFQFKFSHDLTIAASDQYGRLTEEQAAVNGRRFTLETVRGGKVLNAEDSGHPRRVSFVNGLEEPAGVNLYRNGRLVAQASNVGAGREINFELADSLWIGAVMQIEEGVVVHPAILDSVRQKLILTGIASADIVWSGGGPKGGPFVFEMERVVYG